MSMVEGIIRRGSRALAGTCLVLDLTGSSTAAVVRRNGAVTPAAARLAEPSEHVPKCQNRMMSDFDVNTCDSEDRLPVPESPSTTMGSPASR